MSVCVHVCVLNLAKIEKTFLEWFLKKIKIKINWFEKFIKYALLDCLCMCKQTFIQIFLPFFCVCVFVCWKKKYGFSSHLNNAFQTFIFSISRWKENITLLMGQNDSFLLREKISFLLFYCFLTERTKS